MLNKQNLSSKLSIFALVVLLLFLGELKYKQWRNQKAIETEKNQLQAQADALQKKNNELNQSLTYLNSDSFKERVAREQLNLKKDGETIYSFGDAPASQNQTAGQAAPVPNAQKWWDYFFSVQ